jgi:hypothetical protein
LTYLVNLEGSARNDLAGAVEGLLRAVFEDDLLQFFQRRLPASSARELEQARRAVAAADAAEDRTIRRSPVKRSAELDWRRQAGVARASWQRYQAAWKHLAAEAGPTGPSDLVERRLLIERIFLKQAWTPASSEQPRRAVAAAARICRVQRCTAAEAKTLLAELQALVRLDQRLNGPPDQRE